MILWEQQQEGRERILRLVNERQEDIYTKRELREAFRVQPQGWCCMDGRVFGDKPQIGTAGNMVFATTLEIAECVRKVRRDFPRTQMRVLYHDECGAWQHCAKRRFRKSGHRVDPHSHGTHKLRVLRHLLCPDDKSEFACVGFGPDAEYPMSGIPGHHHEVGAIVNGAKCVSPELLGLPSMFTISAKYLQEIHLLKSVRLALKIAFGPHGCGDSFSALTPFIVLVIEDPSHPAWSFREIVRKAGLNKPLVLNNETIDPSRWIVVRLRAV